MDRDISDAENHSDSYDSGIHMDGQDQSYKFQPHPPTFAPDQPARCLQDQLFSALLSTHQEKRGFFSQGQLSQILTEECVRDELAGHLEDSLNEDTIRKYAKKICQETKIPAESSENDDDDDEPRVRCYIKIFAILIMIQKTKAIVKFLEEDVNDSDLPLIKVPRPKDEKLFDLRIRRKPETALKCFHRKWNQLNIRNFEEWQWSTLPLVFGQSKSHKEVMHYQLQEHRILPFIEDSRRDKPNFSRRIELEGGFGRVFKVAIHPEHHNFHQTKMLSTTLRKPDDACFAVKRLHSQNRTAFRKEVEMLNKFSRNKHTHLISLLATYEQFDCFFLLFDWAEADLQRYWREVNPVPSFDAKTVLWVARQCKGIASGITKIHDHISTYAKPDPNSPGNQNVIFGHHGDIKPENVLWFPDPGQDAADAAGTLKLSDFGLAEFSIHQTRSMRPKSKFAISLSYRAPECDLKEGGAIGRSYDIWTLGCLYLEFITWMLGGSRLIDEFLQARKAPDCMWHDIDTHTFFKLEIDQKTGEKKAAIKPAVTQAS